MKFFAPIWNITSCVRRITFPPPFTIESWRVTAFIKFLEQMDLEAALSLDGDFHEYCDPEHPRTMYVAAADATVPTGFTSPDARTEGMRAFLYFESLASLLNRHLSLLHLFDRGDVFVPLWFVTFKHRKRTFISASARDLHHYSPSLYEIDTLLMP
jgi:hypothetical protein